MTSTRPAPVMQIRVIGSDDHAKAVLAEVSLSIPLRLPVFAAIDAQFDAQPRCRPLVGSSAGSCPTPRAFQPSVSERQGTFDTQWAWAMRCLAVSPLLDVPGVGRVSVLQAHYSTSPSLRLHRPPSLPEGARHDTFSSGA
jgi:hypothetical protein